MSEDRANYTVPVEALPDRRSVALAWFNEQMWARLEANRINGDWREMGINWLCDRLAGQMLCGVEELEDAIYQQDWPAVIRKAADMANLPMMVADVARMRLERGKA